MRGSPKPYLNVLIELLSLKYLILDGVISISLTVGEQHSIYLLFLEPLDDEVT